jgi:hypothetical protein
LLQLFLLLKFLKLHLFLMLFLTMMILNSFHNVGWPSWYEIDAICLTGRAVESCSLSYVPPSPGTLAGDLLQLLSSHTGDVTFLTPNGTSIKAHSTIVLARCPTLLKARGDPIHVPDHPSVVAALLQYIYTDTADISASLSIGIFIAAQRYGLDALAARAQQRFAMGLSKDNLIRALEVVGGITPLRASCMQFLASHPAMLTADASFPTDVLTELVPLLAAQLLK